jgi:uncharacterized protein (TIGR03435 family)
VLTPEFASSFGRLTANHLWQSTAFAAVAVLLALALRANRARERHWLWLAASVKFLVPWAALAAIGAALGRWLIPAAPAPRFPFVMEQIVQPFTPMPYPSLPAAPSAPSAASLLPALLLSLWLCGFLAVLLYAWTRYRRVAAAVRSATPLTEGRELEALRKVFRGVGLQACHAGVRAGVLRGCGSAALWGRRFRLPTAPRLVSSTANLEPGVFGIFRPILWLPAGIGDRLEDAELEAILAHELCHIRRRDNLLATLHLLVESIFWFHPLVWWLGARLEEERERACDEEVVRLGGEPQVYAESILKVVEFYLASPVACAAGITGGELKKRIEGIMSSPFTRKLSYGKKILLAAAAVMAIAVPMAVGLINAPRGSAQTPSRAAVSPAPAQPTQSTDAAPLAFEAASVKPCPPGAADGVRIQGMQGGPESGDPGLFRCTNCALRPLLLKAYNLRAYQLFGPPSIDDDKYDINAKVPPGASREDLNLMLQDLLVTRFGLATHKETRVLPIYELVVAKGGSKLKEPEKPPASQPPPASPERPADGRTPAIKAAYATDKNGHADLPPGKPGMIIFFPRPGSPVASASARMMTLDVLLRGLALQFGRPVVDKTGLTGTYDFKLLWVPDQAQMGGIGPTPASAPPSGQAGLLDAASDPAPSLSAAFERQLGLKLEDKKGPVVVLVVDHVNRTPTEN